MTKMKKASRSENEIFLSKNFSPAAGIEPTAQRLEGRSTTNRAGRLLSLAFSHQTSILNSLKAFLASLIPPIEKNSYPLPFLLLKPLTLNYSSLYTGMRTLRK